MSVDLEIKAMRWLRFTKRCPLAFFERGPSPMGSRPDVLGVTLSRHCVEIEIKRTMSDFRANAKKRHVLMREDWIENWPRYFYFLVPPILRDAALAELPQYAGLLTVDDYSIVAIVNAPRNSRSLKISVKSCLKLFRHLGNQVLSSEEKAYRFRTAFKEGHESWGIEYQI